MRSRAIRRGAACLAAALLFSGCGGESGNEGDKNTVTKQPENGPESGQAGANSEGNGGTGEDGTAAVTPAPTVDPNDTRKAYRFDPSVTYQTMDGIGAAYTWYSDWVFASSNPDGALDALFSDAKLTVLRFKNEYEYNVEDTAPNTLNMLRYYEAARDRAAAYGEEVQVLLCCWSPPKFLKADGDITGAASLKKDENGNYCYQEYAEWWAESISWYREMGIAVDYISIQNETEFAAEYDGCVFAPEETEEHASFAKAFLAVYDELQKQFGENAPKMLAPETMSCTYATIQSFIGEILAERPETMYGIAHHLYVGGSGDNEANTVKPDSFLNPFMDLKEHYGNYARWQTEYYVGHGIDTAALINNCLLYEEANCYLYWSGVWDDSSDGMECGYLLGCTRGKSEAYPNGWRLTADYYAVRHFSEFIRPGYTRIQAVSQSRDVRTTAFISGDKSKVALVLINIGDEELEYRLEPQNYAVESAVLYQSVFGATCTSEDTLYRKLGELPEGGTIVLPPKSVTSVDISGSMP
ncbi:MAG: hypothetical protein K2N94_06490 [Lachnospiraceae bacterium]|nr:hypothetical protein [Lachnospiraceae bacterium]